jgi:hypothetical protein
MTREHRRFDVGLARVDQQQPIDLEPLMNFTRKKGLPDEHYQSALETLLDTEESIIHCMSVAIFPAAGLPIPPLSYLPR